MAKKKKFIFLNENRPKSYFEQFRYAIVFDFDIKLEKKQKNIEEHWSNNDDWTFIQFMESYCNKTSRDAWSRLGKYFYFKNVDDVFWIKMRYTDQIKKIITFDKPIDIVV
jgi:hypothetical protein